MSSIDALLLKREYLLLLGVHKPAIQWYVLRAQLSFSEWTTYFDIQFYTSVFAKNKILGE